MRVGCAVVVGAMRGRVGFGAGVGSGEMPDKEVGNIGGCCGVTCGSLSNGKKVQSTQGNGGWGAIISGGGVRRKW